MKTFEQILKIKAVVLYILKRIPEGLDYIHLFKIMYFAQQEHLKIYGLPLMDDTFVARKHGPVPALTYKVLRGLEGKVDVISMELEGFVECLQIHVKNGHQMVTAIPEIECDMDELSKSNVKILNKWIDACKNVNTFDLSGLSHDRAWKRAKKQMEKTGEDTRITLYDMAEAAGASQDMLNVIRERQLNRKDLAWT